MAALVRRRRPHSYVTQQRRRELGIRAARGARPAQLRTLVLSQGMRVAAAGLVPGLIGAVALGRGLSALVFETSPADPLVLAAASVTMLAVATLAAYVPAHTASAVNPGSVLHEE